MKTGKIIIKEKVYFEYYQLYKPDNKDLKYYHNSVIVNNQLKFEYLKDYKEYEASKQLIKVEKVNYSPLSQTWIIEPFDFLDFALDPNQYVVTNNQPCKAEINGERATIIELL